MKLTKYEHACLVLENGGDTLVIDPGAFTRDLVGLSAVTAIVITHEHADHWSPAQLDRIIATNPDVTIFGPAGVTHSATSYPITTVAAGDHVSAGSFTLEFFGGIHATIHASIPVTDNVGVLVNGVFYYAGDSFTAPGVPVDTLAVPAGAPWLKISEVMDYVVEVSPRRSFPTHEMVLSPAGKSMSNTRIDEMTTLGGGEFFALEPGDTLDM
jgi:L-ascorbate metabolism protein UlaG (beta-lactamase superfamily)